MSWKKKSVLKFFFRSAKSFSWGAANENRQPLNAVLPRGTVSRSRVDKWSMRGGWYNCRKAA